MIPTIGSQGTEMPSRVVRGRRWRSIIVLVVACFLLVAASQSALALLLGQRGQRGPTVIYAATCKYGSAPFPGYLRVYTKPPRVQGIRRRPGAEWVRYRAWLVGPSGSTVAVSNWSGWLRARDGRWATWGGLTSFTANWRGNYRIDLRIEWWNQRRLLGWRADRITRYYYIDEWNTRWGGPFTSCMRQPV